MLKYLQSADKEHVKNKFEPIYYDSFKEKESKKILRKKYW